MLLTVILLTLMLTATPRLVPDAYSFPAPDAVYVFLMLLSRFQVVTDIADTALGVLSLGAEIRTGLWRKNGQCMNDQVGFVTFHEFSCPFATFRDVSRRWRRFATFRDF